MDAVERHCGIVGDLERGAVVNRQVALLDGQVAERGVAGDVDIAGNYVARVGEVIDRATVDLDGVQGQRVGTVDLQGAVIGNVEILERRIVERQRHVAIDRYCARGTVFGGAAFAIDG